MKNAPSLLIIGASSRAASWSAVRAGLSVRVFDQFQDLDYPPGCDSQLISEKTACFSESQNAQPEICLPVGGWENDLPLRQSLEKHFELWNTNSQSTHLARDPFLIHRILCDHKLPALQVRKPHENSVSGNWIRKPCRGTGGIGIRRLSTESKNSPGKSDDEHYDQQYIQGNSYSAIFFAFRNGQISLMGITAQLIGCEELPDRPFAYTGSMGPEIVGATEKEHTIRNTLRSMAEALNEQIHFFGLVCLDFILSQGVPYLTEINPRYSASVEILELARRHSFLCNFLEETTSRQKVLSEAQVFPKRVLGKSILFASRKFQIPEDFHWEDFTQQLGRTTWKYNPWTVPILSDLPRPGVRFSVGDPICTVWAEGISKEECRPELQERTHLLKSFLGI